MPLFRFILSVALLAVLGCCAPAPGSAPGSGSSVLLVTIDTLRADRLGCYGYAAAETPHLDALAAAGVRVDPVTTAVPVTLPAHATLFTGLVPPNHGVRHNGTFRLAAVHTTLAERLSAAGYATGAFVGAYVLDSRYGLDQGFDRYDDDLDGGATAGAGQYAERRGDRVVDAAIDWIDGLDPARPAFTWVHLFDPHGPYTPPAPWDERFDGRPYDGEIAFADHQVGRLIAALRARGRLDDTLIVVTADHGEGLGEHDEPTHADLIYDSTLRIPWILQHPALERGRTIDDRVAGAVDLTPTLLAFLGIDHDPAALDGRDILDGPPDAERALYVESLVPLLDYGWAPLHGLRTRDDKYILAPAPETFDLVADPGELHNLFPDGAATRRLAAELERRLAGWTPALEVLGRERTLDPDERRRLESLGYLQRSAADGRIGTKDPKTMMGHWGRLNEAGRLSAEGRHPQAIAAILAVLREDPGSSKGWYTATQIHDLAGRREDAEACLRRALELNPKAEGWVILARYALARGDRDTFEHALVAAERLDPTEGGIFLGRGYALAQQGRLAEARAQFARALDVDPVRSGADARAQMARIDARLDRAN